MISGAPTAVLLLHGEDRPGLVAAVSERVLKHGGNILHADQHTDRESNLFLQRVEWSLERTTLNRSQWTRVLQDLTRQLDMKGRIYFSHEKPRIALFVSRLGHCLYDLLARWSLGEWRAEIVGVLSNHPDLSPVARQFRVPFIHIPLSPTNKAAQEKKTLSWLTLHRVDVVVLARYMQLLGPQLVQAYRERAINIHHSFLPAFAGAQPYHQAHRRGVKIIGATAHYVTGDLDQGPIIEQDVVRVDHRDTPDDMIRKGRDLEKGVLARALRYHLERRVMVYGNKTVVFD